MPGRRQRRRQQGVGQGWGSWAATYCHSASLGDLMRGAATTMRGHAGQDIACVLLSVLQCSIAVQHCSVSINLPACPCTCPMDTAGALTTLTAASSWRHMHMLHGR